MVLVCFCEGVANKKCASDEFVRKCVSVCKCDNVVCTFVFLEALQKGISAATSRLQAITQVRWQIADCDIAR